MGRTVTVTLTANIVDLKAKLREGGTAVRQFTGELDKAAKGGHLDKVSDRAAIMGGALVGAFGYAVKAAADFDKAMSGVSAATHAGAGDMAAFRQAALQAGKDTQYSATESANAITELAKAGVHTSDILNGGLKGALSLAAAGQMDVTEAAETAASALTQFRLSGAQVPHVADLLAAAAGKAQGSVHDVGMALNQSGLVASQFGLSIEDTTGALAEFANAGLIGSDAGTSFKTMLLSIANPSKVTATVMQSLGISFYDAQGKFIGLSGVAEVLRARLKNVSQETRQQALGQIFGNDAIRAATVLYNDGAAGVDKWKNAVNDSGYASQTAAKLTDNLAGDMERLKGSLETLAIQGGSGPNSGIRVLVKGLNDLVNAVLALPGPVTSTLTVLAGLSGGALLLGAGWIKVRKSTAAVRAELEALGPAGQIAATGMSKVSAVAGKVSLALAALEAANALVGSFQSDLNPQMDALAVGLQNYAASGQLAGEASRVLGGDLKDLDAGFRYIADTDNSRRQALKHIQDGLESIVPGLDGTNTSLTKTQERISAVDQTLAQMVTGGNATGAQQAFQKLASQLAVGGVSMDEFRKQFPAYAAAVETAGSSTKAAAGQVGDLNQVLQDGENVQKGYASAADAAAAAARGERVALVDLAKMMHAETDPVFALLNAQQGLAAAQKEATKAIKDHGRNSAQAQDATRKLALAAIDLQDATGKLGSDFDGKLSPALIQTLRNAGLTKAEINNLAGQFRLAKRDADKYDGSYAATASAPGAKQATRELNLAYTAANHFAGPYQAQVSVTGDETAKVKLARLAAYQQALKRGVPIDVASLQGSGGKMRFAEGGWTGPGDTYQPAGVVHADEFVIRKSSRQKIEAKAPGLLDQMNASGYVPGYAAGGVVLPFPVTATKTKIPSRSDVENAVMPAGGGAGPGGGETYKWILAVVARAFPGLHATSTFRKGAVTLSGNRSYHAVGRAVDFPPSKPLAEWVNLHYFGRTKELITPWNSLNIHNGRRHAYTGDIYAQHAGIGRFKGNAHDHWAMAGGGIIPEHVIGVGRSGRTYEFGERGPERVTPLRGYAGGGLVNVAPSSETSSSSSPARGSRLDTAEAMLSARGAVASLSTALKENGRQWSFATQKGRDNRSALISGIKAAQDAARAKYAETGSVKAANAVYDSYLRMLNRTLQLGKNSAAVRASLLRQYSQRPTYDVPTPTPAAPSNSGKAIAVMQGRMGAQEQLDATAKAFAWTKPTFVSTTEAGRSELSQLFSFLGAAQQAAQTTFDATGNSKQATQIYNVYVDQLRRVLGRWMTKAQIDSLLKTYGRITLTRNRWGGLYSAADGALTEATIAAGGPTRYQWAEPATGGELFAPRRGNLAKTRREVGWAVANWWGGQVNWQPGTSSGTAAGRHVTVNATIPIQLGAETITRQVRLEVDAQLGKVVDATVYQSA